MFVWALHVGTAAILGFLAFYGLAFAIRKPVLGLDSLDARVLFATQGLFLGFVVGILFL